MKKNLAPWLVPLWLVAASAQAALKPSPLTFDYTPETIAQGCQAEVDRLGQAIKTVEAAKTSSFEAVVIATERALNQFSTATSPMMFMSSVSPTEAVRKAAEACEVKASSFLVDLFAREDLYRVFKRYADKGEKLDEVAALLLDDYMKGFKRNGLALGKKERAHFLGLKKQLVELETRFNSRLNEWKETITADRKDLEGLSDEFVASLDKTADGRYIVTLAYPHYFAVMENAKSAAFRRAIETKYNQRGGLENRADLQKAIALRDEMARMLGYPNHAAFQLDERMAKTPQAVTAFLDGLRGKLKAKGEQDLAVLLELKRQETKNPKEQTLYSWDWRYYENQLKKTKYQVDHEKIKEYFPLDKVLAGMFDTYQTLFGVRFVKTPDAKVWHDSVEAFAVTDPKTGAVISYFYMDLFPRAGKYGHAAAFTLRDGQVLADGSYQKPISSIVANFNAPTSAVPSLLLHDQVETLFHEFGHIMHQVLTRARYGSFSGTSVKRDFVEAPSQIFENWVWHKEVLQRISGHYKTGAPFSDELLAKLVQAKNANQSIRYLRQLFFAVLDMTYHTQGKVDTTKVYADLMKDIMLIPMLDGTYPEASFGHLMGGYDAGYYGYLWSEVYAADMFTRFAREGLFNSKTGLDYRKWILEPGGSKEPEVLVKGFLGREPNQKAFLEELGVPTT